ncbi:MAG: response regulator, partial [Bacteroidales bacterium]|nr:response regulator [Bacteroidales bacterium]
MKTNSIETGNVEKNECAPKTLLIVEDDEGLNRLISRRMKREGFKTIQIFRGDQLLNEINENNTDLLLLIDFRLPDMTAVELIDRMHHDNLDVPFLVMTGQGDETTAVELMKRGALDYLIKDNNFLEILPRKIHKACEVVEQSRRMIRVEKALRESEKKYRLLYNSIWDAILVTDTSRNIIDCNPAFLKIFGFQQEEITGRKTFVIDAKQDEYEEMGRMLQENFENKPFIKVVQYKKKNGEVFPGETGSFYLKDESGKIEGFIGLIRDVSERIKAEEELIIAKEKAEENDKLKSAFLANMSHEVRTPMNGIMGFAELLKEPGLTRDEQLNYISIIVKSGDRMLNTLNDILNISRIEVGQMEVDISVVNINEQIDYLRDFFNYEITRKGMHLYIHKDLSDEQADIYTDKEKLYGILINLIKNAIKYSNEGYIDFGYRLKDKLLEFYVKDSGIGIDKEKLESIFERFVQADVSNTRGYEGAGLGLSLARAYVELLEGKINVESEKGKGTIFHVSLPYKSAIKNKVVSQAADIGSSGGEQKRKPMTVLIAEDEEPALIYLQQVLKRDFEKILHAKNGVEALEICRSTPDIDLILMDIRMPKMDGHTATRKIREFNKDVAIIAQTAHALGGDREEALAAGCDDY